ncbi:MAG TPA: hypothetical protein PLV42_09050 [bacterium]|nr:hypothetical protein [bacterium]
MDALLFFIDENLEMFAYPLIAAGLFLAWRMAVKDRAISGKKTSDEAAAG